MFDRMVIHVKVYVDNIRCYIHIWPYTTDSSLFSGYAYMISVAIAHIIQVCRLLTHSDTMFSFYQVPIAAA